MRMALPWYSRASSAVGTTGLADGHFRNLEEFGELRHQTNRSARQQRQNAAAPEGSKGSSPTIYSCAI